MRLLRIDTNKGAQIDGGFLHTVFEKSTVNGKVSTDQIVSQKFTMILNEPEWIEGMLNDPKKFIADLAAPQPQPQPSEVPK